MNQAQLDRLLFECPVCPLKAKAIELVIIDGLSSYAAEKQIYGKPTNTVARMVKDVRRDYERCLQVAAM